MVSVVCGMLVARRFKGDVEAVGAACIGDGATSTGSFHEAVNLAAVEKLPLVIAVANNQFAYSTPTDRQFACADLVDRAIGYGIDGHRVDGTDLAECLDVFGRAVARARAGHGPQLVVGRLLRLTGHGAHDDANYVPDALKQTELGRDCLERARQHLLDHGLATVAELEQWDREAVHDVQLAVATAILANHGQHPEPQIVQSLQNSTGIINLPHEQRPAIVLADDNNWRLIEDALFGVNHRANGTANKVFKNANYTSGGKTGTAQVFSLGENETYNAKTLAEHKLDNAMYIGFAPLENPQIVLAVTVENVGGGSANAAPIARRLFDHYLNR